MSEGGEGGCASGRALVDPAWIAVSRDGKHVYVASEGNGTGDAIAIFERD